MSDIPKIGEIFEDRYEIESILGSGGIGTVYKAQQLDFQRTIALKVLHHDTAVDEEYRLRFLREAQTLNKLSHTNIVTVYHLGISKSGLPFIAMEYVQGKSVRMMLNETERLPVLQALKITADAARAMNYVHKEGIVHRDLKPENILITNHPEPDTVKIADFGLVSQTQQKEQKLTSTGQLIGTAKYMSPEQCQGKPVDYRADIYSLSTSLYEMLSGNSPFDADNAIGLMYKHINETVPKLDTGKLALFHPQINDLISKGMAKDPTHRFSSMDEFASEIDKTIALLNPNKAQGPMSKIMGAVILLAAILAIFSLVVFAGRTIENQRIATRHFEEAAAVKANISSQESYLINALSRAEKRYGSNSEKLFRPLMAICDYLNEHSRLKESQPYAIRLFELSRQKGSALEKLTAGANLASCYGRQQKSADEEKTLRLTLAECKLPPELPLRLQLASMLAACLEKQGKILEAIVLGKQVIELKEKSAQLDTETTDTIFLARCYANLGDEASAETYYQKTIQIYENRPTSNDKMKLYSYIEYGTFLLEHDHFVQAESVFKLAQTIYSKQMVKDIKTQDILQIKLVDSLSGQNKINDASTILKHLIAEQELLLARSRSEDVEVLLNAIDTLEKSYVRQGKSNEFESYLKSLWARQTEKLHTPIIEEILLEKLAIICANRERWAESSQYFKSAQEAIEKLYPAESPQAILNLLRTGDAYVKLGKNQIAEPYFTQAEQLEARSKLFLHNEVSRADVLIRLASFYSGTDKKYKALPLIRQGLAIQEAQLGADRVIIGTRFLLADCLLDAGKRSEAKSLLNELIAKDDSGKVSDKYTATAFDKLGDIYCGERNFDAAAPLRQRALSINEKNYRKHDEQSTTMLYQSIERCAALDLKREKYTEIDPLIRRLVELSQNSTDGIQRGVAWALSNIADGYLEQEKSADAQPLIQDALTIINGIDKKQHKDQTLGETFSPGALAQALTQLGRCLITQGKFSDAAPILERATIIEIKAGNYNILAATLNELAQCYTELGKSIEFESLCLKYLKEYDSPKREDLTTATILESLRQYYEKQYRMDKSAPLLKRAFAIRQRLLPPDNPEEMNMTIAIANNYITEHKFNEARQLLDQALAILDKSQLGAAPILKSEVLRKMSLLYVESGEPHKAELACKRSLDFAEKRLSADSPDLIWERLSLADSYEHQHEFAESKAVLLTALSSEESLRRHRIFEACILVHLAENALSSGNAEDAEHWAKKAITICDMNTYAQDERIWKDWSLEHLAVSYIKRGINIPTASLITPIIELCKNATLGERHAVNESLMHIASYYVKYKKYEAAQEVLSAAIKLTDSNDGRRPNDYTRLLTMQDAVVRESKVFKNGDANQLLPKR